MSGVWAVGKLAGIFLEFDFTKGFEGIQKNKAKIRVKNCYGTKA